MQKVIVERPRSGAAYASDRGTARRIRPVEVDEDFDSGPRRASSARRDKWFNEHLQPLWRYLRSNVGRPWDKVYSEICATLDGRGVLGNHVLDHLRWEVETHCALEGKTVVTSKGERVYGFYVHPRTGLLLEAPRWRWKRRQRREAVELVTGPRDELYRLVDGLWYEVAYRIEDGDTVLAHKRQCGSKQIAQIRSWIDDAERGRPGYSRGADSVRVPHGGLGFALAA